jgi:hypothetical protein
VKDAERLYTVPISMTNSAQEYAVEVEKAISLERELGDIGVNSGAQPEILITMMPNPERDKIMLWSMEDGTSVITPRYRVKEMLSKVDQFGAQRFTADKAKAPPVVTGSWKCFLSRNSEERANGELQEAGLMGATICRYEHGPSEWAKNEHQRKKHPNSSKIWQDYQDRKEREEAREEQREMQRTMMLLASQAAQSKEIADIATANQPVCPDCGWRVSLTSRNPGASLNMHMRRYCPERTTNGEQEASTDE